MPRDQALLSLDQAWNDFLVSFEQVLPDDDEGLSELMAKSIEHCSEEMETGHRFECKSEQLSVQIQVCGDTDAATEPLLLAGICNKTPGGGHLGKQVQSILDRTEKQVPTATPIIVRSTEFTPKNPKAAITKLFAQLIARGGRYVIVPESGWRAMAAMQHFRNLQRNNSYFNEWLRHTMPLTRLESLRRILDLDEIANRRRASRNRSENDLNASAQDRAQTGAGCD